jgi:methionine aminopeptidase
MFKLKENLLKEQIYLGNVIHNILDIKLINIIKPGISLDYIANLIYQWIIEANVSSIQGFFIDGNLINCPVHISIENIICHGFPSKNIFLKENQLVRIDLVVFRNGIYADAARTFCTSIPNQIQTILLNVAKESIKKITTEIRSGNYLSDIAKIITEIANKNNIFLAPYNLSGHGIGEKLHMQPSVLNVFNKEYFKQNDMLIYPGQILCIEPIFSSKPIKKIYIDEEEQIIASVETPIEIVHYEQMIQFFENYVTIFTDK